MIKVGDVVKLDVAKLELEEFEFLSVFEGVVAHLKSNPDKEYIVSGEFVNRTVPYKFTLEEEALSMIAFAEDELILVKSVEIA